MVQQAGHHQSFSPVRARGAATLLDDHRHTRRPSEVHETAHGYLMRLRSLFGAHPKATRGHRGSNQHDRRRPHTRSYGGGAPASALSHPQETRRRRTHAQPGEVRILQARSTVLRPQVYQGWSVPHRRARKGPQGVQDPDRRQVVAKLSVHGTLERKVHERRQHDRGTTVEAVQEWSVMGVDRDRRSRLSSTQGRNLDQVHGVLQERLANGADIRREPGWAGWCPLPIQPGGPHSETYSMLLLPLADRRRTPLQPG